MAEAGIADRRQEKVGRAGMQLYMQMSLSRQPKEQQAGPRKNMLQKALSVYECFLGMRWREMKRDETIETSVALHLLILISPSSRPPPCPSPHLSH